MTVSRFFVDLDLAVGQEVALPEPVAHHATRVLRLGSDAPLVLFNGRGGEFAARLRVSGKRASALVTQFDPVERESSLALALVQSWVATEKLDWIVEKAVELGAARIVLMPSERSVVRLQGERLARRMTHLRQIAIAACAQCGRNRLPEVIATDALDAALGAAGDGPRFLLAPDAAQLTVATASGTAAVVLVGPEGGFSEHEIAAARSHGCQPIRLGPRILRTETAGLAALAALQALRGDFCLDFNG